LHDKTSQTLSYRFLEMQKSANTCVKHESTDFEKTVEENSPSVVLFRRVLGVVVFTGALVVAFSSSLADGAGFLYLAGCLQVPWKAKDPPPKWGSLESTRPGRVAFLFQATWACCFSPILLVPMSIGIDLNSFERENKTNIR